MEFDSDGDRGIPSDLIPLDVTNSGNEKTQVYRAAEDKRKKPKSPRKHIKGAVKQKSASLKKKVVGNGRSKAAATKSKKVVSKIKIKPKQKKDIKKIAKPKKSVPKGRKNKR